MLYCIEGSRVQGDGILNNSIRTAAIIAITGNALLAGLKIVMGILSKSNALLGDGIDSSTDVVIGVMALAVVKIISKPADETHPFGHKRAETVTTAFLSFVIFFAGAQLVIASASNLINDTHMVAPSPMAVCAALVSIAGKMLLAFSQYALGKRANSSMITANAKNMASDVVISAGVLVGFILTFLTGWGHTDSVVAILVGLWIIKTAFSIVLDVNLELMDGNTDSKPYTAIVEAVDAVEGVSNPHRARVRRISGFWDIEFDLDTAPERTVLEAHRLASRVEHEIKARVENVFDIMIHIEPRGDTSSEAFGLSEDNMRTK
jgi:cation diffusion facilitator family transporter